MNRFIPACTFAAACAFAVSVSAQDTTVKSKTKIDADDAHVVTMTGCLSQSGDVYMLSNATMTKGDDMKSKSKTKIDVDENETEVKDQSKTQIEHEDKTVGTAGIAAYELTPKDGVNLVPHIGHKVEITAVATEPGKGDAEVTMKTETQVKPEDAPDSKVKSKTKMELPRGASSRLTVLSVKHISPSCTM